VFRERERDGGGHNGGDRRLEGPRNVVGESLKKSGRGELQVAFSALCLEGEERAYPPQVWLCFAFPRSERESETMICHSIMKRNLAMVPSI
jgi:hypothetical protein